MALVAIGAGLRLWNLGRLHLDFDEAFTATAARLPVGRLFSFLRADDAHPPLDYLLRRPAALHGASEAVLRLPSAVLSIGALGAFAAWMRHRQLLGVLATAVLAVAAFQLTYAQDARMYAGMVTVGVVASWSADSWMGRPRATPAAAAAVALLAGVFLHASALFLAAGLFLLPGLRRDRDAWWWRVAVAAPVVVWAATWGPAFLHQASRTSGGWIPHTTPGYLGRTLNELVSSYSTTTAIVVVIVTAGCIVAGRADRSLGRVLVCAVAVPVALVAAVGVRGHVLLPRTLAFASWAPAIGLAAIVAEAGRRKTTWAAGAAVLLAALVLPSTADALRPHEPVSTAPLVHVDEVARPGDAVGINPAFLWPLTHWYLGVRRRGPDRPLALPDLRADVLLLGDGPWDGRVWFLEPTSYRAVTTGWVDCAPVWRSPGYRVRCLTRQANG